MAKSKNAREFQERMRMNNAKIDDIKNAKKLEEQEVRRIEEEAKRKEREEEKRKTREEILEEASTKPTEQKLRELSLEELKEKYPKHCSFACRHLRLYSCNNDEFKKDMCIEFIVNGANEESLKRKYISILETESQTLTGESLDTLQDKVVALGGRRLSQQSMYYLYNKMREEDERSYCIYEIMRTKFIEYWERDIEKFKEELSARKK